MDPEQRSINIASRANTPVACLRSGIGTTGSTIRAVVYCVMAVERTQPDTFKGYSLPMSDRQAIKLSWTADSICDRGSLRKYPIIPPKLFPSNTFE